MSGCRTYKHNRWYPFDMMRGCSQALPPAGRPVLLRGESPDNSGRLLIAVGVRRGALGKTSSRGYQKVVPYFETPFGWTAPKEWNDCLADGLTLEDLQSSTYHPKAQQKGTL